MGEVRTELRQELARRLLANPLQPFDIVTRDRRYPIRRRFQAAVGKGIVLWVPPTGEGSKRFQIDDIPSLASAET